MLGMRRLIRSGEALSPQRESGRVGCVSESGMASLEHQHEALQKDESCYCEPSDRIVKIDGVCDLIDT